MRESLIQARVRKSLLNLSYHLGLVNIGCNLGKNLGFARIVNNLKENLRHWKVGCGHLKNLRTIILVTILVRITGA